DSISIFLISDKEKPQNIDINIQQMDYSGKIISSENISTLIDNSKAYLTYKIPKSIFENNIQSLIHITAKKEDSLVADYFYYPIKPKEMQLSKTIIQTNITENNGLYFINLNTDVLAKNIEIITNIDGDLSDNYFDLLPNENKKILFTPSEKGKLNIKIRVLNNLYQ
ncbi:MAG: hypothetical protein KAG84_02650, partial [Bacteroidales bacterium]|nr:hypothetical protein [Bacteroidales bacterium]